MAGLYGNYNGNTLVGQPYGYSQPMMQQPIAPSMQYGTWNNSYSNNFMPKIPSVSPNGQAPVSTNTGVIWVNGIEGAKGYIIAPNSTMILMDSDQNYFYLKSANDAGVASIRVFEFKEKQQTEIAKHDNISTDIDEKLKNYVPRSEFDEIKKLMTTMSDSLNVALGGTNTKQTTPPTNKTNVVETKKEVRN